MKGKTDKDDKLDIDDDGRRKTEKGSKRQLENIQYRIQLVDIKR